MTFEQWWDAYIAEGGHTHFNIHADKESAKAAWDAAHDRCAELCEHQQKTSRQRYELGLVCARAIRELK
jgi:hypothetical protein